MEKILLTTWDVSTPYKWWDIYHSTGDFFHNSTGDFFHQQSHRCLTLPSHRGQTFSFRCCCFHCMTFQAVREGHGHLLPMGLWNGEWDLILLKLYISGTQMTLVLFGKDLVLEGSPTKIEDKRVPGIYSMYVCMYACMHVSMYACMHSCGLVSHSCGRFVTLWSL